MVLQLSIGAWTSPRMDGWVEDEIVNLGDYGFLGSAALFFYLLVKV